MQKVTSRLWVTGMVSLFALYSCAPPKTQSRQDSSSVSSVSLQEQDKQQGSLANGMNHVNRENLFLTYAAVDPAELKAMKASDEWNCDDQLQQCQYIGSVDDVVEIATEPDAFADQSADFIKIHIPVLRDNVYLTSSLQSIEVKIDSDIHIILQNKVDALVDQSTDKQASQGQAEGDEKKVAMTAEFSFQMIKEQNIAGQLVIPVKINQNLSEVDIQVNAYLSDAACSQVSYSQKLKLAEIGQLIAGDQTQQIYDHHLNMISDWQKTGEICAQSDEDTLRENLTELYFFDPDHFIEIPFADKTLKFPLGIKYDIATQKLYAGSMVKGEDNEGWRFPVENDITAENSQVIDDINGILQVQSLGSLGQVELCQLREPQGMSNFCMGGKGEQTLASLADKAYLKSKDTGMAILGGKLCHRSQFPPIIHGKLGHAIADSSAERMHLAPVVIGVHGRKINKNKREDGERKDKARPEFRGEGRPVKTFGKKEERPVKTFGEESELGKNIDEPKHFVPHHQKSEAITQTLCSVYDNGLQNKNYIEGFGFLSPIKVSETLLNGLAGQEKLLHLTRRSKPVSLHVERLEDSAADSDFQGLVKGYNELPESLKAHFVTENEYQEKMGAFSILLQIPSKKETRKIDPLPELSPAIHKFSLAEDTEVDAPKTSGDSEEREVELVPEILPIHTVVVDMDAKTVRMQYSEHMRCVIVEDNEKSGETNDEKLIKKSVLVSLQGNQDFAEHLAQGGFSLEINKAISSNGPCLPFFGDNEKGKSLDDSTELLIESPASNGDSVPASDPDSAD